MGKGLEAGIAGTKKPPLKIAEWDGDIWMLDKKDKDGQTGLSIIST